MSALLFLLALGAGVVAAVRARPRWIYAVPPALLVLALVVTWNGFVVQKWLARLCMPTGILWLGLFAVGLVTLRRRERRLAAAMLLLFCGYSCAGNEVVGTKLVGFLENDHPAPAAPGVPYDAVVVLGGGTGETPDDTVQLAESGDRLIAAARHFHRGHTKLLVATGISAEGVSSPEARDLSGEARALWRDLGIPDAAIVAVPEGRNTSEEITVIARLIGERGWKRVGLVTSAWHMPRAMRLAARHSLALTPLPADYRGGRTMLSIVQVVPSAEGFEHTELAAWEWVGRLVGR
ncbi:MAG TPA: YdcF family protein [Polyangiaceae bacterium]|nr:YdcF family protein [Polyangiaceae bacterium]